MLLLTTCTILAYSALAADSNEEIHVNGELAAKFSRLALDCVQREYPNKIAHVLNTAQDARTP